MRLHKNSIAAAASIATLAMGGGVAWACTGPGMGGTSGTTGTTTTTATTGTSSSTSSTAAVRRNVRKHASRHVTRR
jgi:hypothetical protein